MSLFVYLNQDKVGRLDQDVSGNLEFTYDFEWLQHPEKFPLSLNLPLQKEPFDNAKTKSFFVNLLPEGTIREALARIKKIAPENDFEMLKAYAGACAGAVSLWAEDQKPDFEEDERKITPAELLRKIKSTPQRPLIVDEHGLRLSLAGAQQKTSIRYRNQEFFEPTGFGAGHFIIKPALEKYKYSVENEAFCMLLAARVGLRVPLVSIINIGESVYIVQRFDRQTTKDGGTIRIHQEDFCQALGLLPYQKYDPSAKSCFELLNKSRNPMEDKWQFLFALIFNSLIGNADAHVKNFSWLITPKGFELAPFYDLLSTSVYGKDLSQKMAMAIGGEDRVGYGLQRQHWICFLEEIGMNPAIFENLKSFAASVEGQAKIFAKEFTAIYGAEPFIQKIVWGLSKRWLRLSA